MHIVSATRLVRSDAADLNGVRSVGRSSRSEGVSDEGDDVVSAGKDEVADETLVAVDDEVPAELFGFLFSSHKLCGGGGLDVAAHGLEVRRSIYVMHRVCDVILTRTMTGTRPQSFVYS